MYEKHETIFIKIIEPYGYIRKTLLKSVHKINNSYRMRDIYGSTYRIDENTYDALKG